MSRPKQVLVLGGGGREHVLADKLSLSQEVTRVFCHPGNGGMEDIHRNSRVICPKLGIPLTDTEGLYEFAIDQGIDLVVCGPEGPLANGLADRFREGGIPVLGPGATGARLESSKSFAKDFMLRHDIPTAPYRVFDDEDEARHYVLQRNCPLVVKADGLAGGKGVYPCNTAAGATAAVIELMANQVHGRAGKRIIIEDRLQGPECSFFALVSGQKVLQLGTAMDYKRAHNDDDGPNTGGMGAVSPNPHMTEELERQIMDAIVTPTVEGLAAENIDYRGVLFIGLMLTPDGPKVLEYNVRFGDPEAQVIVPRINTSTYSFYDMLYDAATGELKDHPTRWHPGVYVGLNLVSGAYPAAESIHAEITGFDRLSVTTPVFHGATVREHDGKLYATGGRILTVVGSGWNYAEARVVAYHEAEKINFKGMRCRGDIARGL